MQPLNRQRSNGLEIVANSFKIGGQQQLHLALQGVISRFKGLPPRWRQLQHQRRFINLHPLDAALRQFGQHLLVNRQDGIQQAQTIKRFAFHFTQPQVRYRPQQHRFHVVAQRQRFVYFIQQLGRVSANRWPFTNSGTI